MKQPSSAKKQGKKTAKAAPVTEVNQPTTGLFQARLLGYLVGLIPLFALLLMFRQIIPETVALVAVMLGTMASVLVQQRVRKKYAFNFRNRAEWLALGVYSLIVIGLTLAFFYFFPMTHAQQKSSATTTSVVGESA